MQEILREKNNIIIVDDDPLITSSLKTFLTLESYVPAVFNSPGEALEYVKINKTDLVISDFLMPGMNGINFLAEVKKIHPGASLILLTGYADKESAIKAINEIGLYRYIEKPWDNEDLLLCIKNGLERSHLIEKLEHKISELEKAKHQLENHNDRLESIVKERTEELRKSNQELQEINTKLSAVINHCADGIITVLQQGIICQANPAFEKISGQSISTLLNKNFSNLLISENNIPVHNKLDPNKDILVRDYKLINKEREIDIPVEISFAPILSAPESEVYSYVAVIRDITPQYEAERLRDDFIATLTHDLRTPLLAAIQTLKFFIDGSLGKLTDRQEILLSTMLHSNQDMLGLVNALLEVYRYESGQLVLCKDYINLNELIVQCTQEVKSLLDQKNLKLDINFNYADERKGSIYADKQELRRVLANLLGNAINYTQQDGKINISTNYNDDIITVIVEDNGTGIPCEDIPKLFNRFSQGTSKKRSTGTGLGLYLSRQIIEAHGGKIWLESEIGKGSKFIFNIPDI